MSLVLYVDASQAASRVVLELVAVVASASLSIQRVDRALPIPHPLEDHDKVARECLLLLAVAIAVAHASRIS